MSGLPRIALRTEAKPPHGFNSYQAVPEMVEFRRAGDVPSRVRAVGLGRMLLTLACDDGELVALQCYVKTSRWKTGAGAAPPEPDAEGVLTIIHPDGSEDFSYLPAQPRFAWHDESASLRVSMGQGTALVFRVADCLLAGVDRDGGLTDIWMLGLDLSLG